MTNSQRNKIAEIGSEKEFSRFARDPFSGDIEGSIPVFWLDKSDKIHGVWINRMGKITSQFIPIRERVMSGQKEEPEYWWNKY